MLREQRLEFWHAETAVRPGLEAVADLGDDVSFLVCITSTMDFSPTPKQAQTVRPVSSCPRGAGAQWLSGTTPTCGMAARPVLRACSWKPRLRQKNAPGMVVGITST